MRYILFIPLLLCLFAPSCEKDKSDKQSKLTDSPYDFNQPDEIFELPKSLEEISGLSFFDDSTLVAIEDEKAILYFIDVKTGELKRTQKWGKRGDYEDVQVIDETIWILRSDATLFRLKLDESQDIKSVKSYDTFLGASNDTEGLAYLKDKQQLLIACKESPGKGQSRTSRSVYAFDLKKKKLLKTPILSVELEDLGGIIGAGAFHISTFKPSALRVNPLDSLLYIVSSGKKSLVSFRGTSIIAMFDLPGVYHEQPEGLEFNSQGDMFIANEGNGGRALLLRYNRRK